MKDTIKLLLACLTFLATVFLICEAALQKRTFSNIHELEIQRLNILREENLMQCHRGNAMSDPLPYVPKPVAPRVVPQAKPDIMVNYSVTT